MYRVASPHSQAVLTSHLGLGRQQGLVRHTAISMWAQEACESRLIPSNAKANMTLHHLQVGCVHSWNNNTALTNRARARILRLACDFHFPAEELA